jgi:CRISPR-associated endonuclease/helicase Cas3
LRLSPIFLQSLRDLSGQLDSDSNLATLLDFAKSPENDIPPRDFPQILQHAAQEALLVSEVPEVLREALKDFANAPQKIIRVERYPGSVGIVIQAATGDMAMPDDDSGDDSTSDAARPVLLRTHLVDVVQFIKNTLKCIALENWAESLILAAAMHDYGKVDERFQALLLGGNLNLAWAQIEPLAKSTKIPGSATIYEYVRQRAKLPKQFRHEFLSAQLALKIGVDDELALHLIAAHHGYARPFAPVVVDDNPPDVFVDWAEKNIALSSVERAAIQPHRLDSGVGERFWRLTRGLGWWNLAYLEAVLRLADQQVSASYNILEVQ